MKWLLNVITLSSHHLSKIIPFESLNYYELKRNLRSRIHFFLRLIVEFMDKFPFVENFFREVTCVSRSNQISLASLLRLVWNRLKTIPDSISRHMVSRINAKTQILREKQRTVPLNESNFRVTMFSTFPREIFKFVTILSIEDLHFSRIEKVIHFRIVFKRNIIF